MLLITLVQQDTTIQFQTDFKQTTS